MLGIFVSACADSLGEYRFTQLVRQAVLLSVLIWAGIGTLSAAADIVVVYDDKGGALIERTNLIQRYKTAGTRVEIRGEYCLSACTLYLGLQNACVSERTIFGFHGPSSRLYGISLSPADFERWSSVMADLYPEPLRTWFILEARHTTVGFRNISGSSLIDMGIKKCVG